MAPFSISAGTHAPGRQGRTPDHPEPRRKQTGQALPPRYAVQLLTNPARCILVVMSGYEGKCDFRQDSARDYFIEDVFAHVTMLC